MDLYKLMVSSSEGLVARRQGVNTFFLTINGVVLTAVGLIVSNGSSARLESWGLGVLTLTGAILALAWKPNSLVRTVEFRQVCRYQSN